VVINVNEEFAQAVQSSTLRLRILECADLSALWFGCDLSQPAYIEFTVAGTWRQAAADPKR